MVKTNWRLPAPGLTDVGTCRELESCGLRGVRGLQKRKLSLVCHEGDGSPFSIALSVLSEMPTEALISVVLNPRALRITFERLLGFIKRGEVDLTSRNRRQAIPRLFGGKPVPVMNYSI